MGQWERIWHLFCVFSVRNMKMLLFTMAKLTPKYYWDLYFIQARYGSLLFATRLMGWMKPNTLETRPESQHYYQLFIIKALLWHYYILVFFLSCIWSTCVCVLLVPYTEMYIWRHLKYVYRHWSTICLLDLPDDNTDPYRLLFELTWPVSKGDSYVL